MLSQTRSHLVVACKTYRGHRLCGRATVCRLEGRILNTQLATSLVYLLTVHYHPHTPDKAVDDLEGLRCGHASLVVGESV
jgi:hypothetical protein